MSQTTQHLYTEDQLFQINSNITTDILSDVLITIMTHSLLKDWPDMLTASLLRLAHQHAHPAAFLATMAGHLARASAKLQAQTTQH